MEVVLECTHCDDVEPVRTFADGRAFLREHRSCGESYLTDDLLTDGGMAADPPVVQRERAVRAVESIAAAMETRNIREARKEALSGRYP